ncbi:MAG: arsenosugar biosynthesis radical SAM protein ArsS [Magnetococcus sp. MYC-9]
MAQDPLSQETPPDRFPPLRRDRLEILQANLGYRCNQSCTHCHVEAGPRRTESMRWQTMEELLRFAGRHAVQTLDLTGGAPEWHPRFRDLVVAARAMGLRVIDRCNLTILSEPGQGDLAPFMAAQQVEISASLPCYLAENVDRQRGRGAFAASIAGLQRLNRLGYGQPGSGLVLNLVYNPGGPSLPPEQQTLEASYRRRLGDEHGVCFNRLFVMVNMPIQRFRAQMVAQGQLESYRALLQAAFRPENLQAVMCRHLLSVDWRGFVYDCDFNQMLGLSVPHDGQEGVPLSAVWERAWPGQEIRVGSHCYGCVAGQGSSCQGALAA